MFGDEEARTCFESFNKRHPRLKLIRNKCWGVGLLELPAAFPGYLRGKDKQALRTNRKRSQEAGLFYKRFSAWEFLDDILAINASAAMRQGREMSREYLERGQLERYFAGKRDLHGVFNPEGRLRAYADVPLCGDVAVLSRLLGHAADLDSGIMYLLISEIVRELIQGQETSGRPCWLMYDTFFGASTGLRYFKERLGFQPYRVRWVWDPD
jgi:hypothetical protein